MLKILFSVAGVLFIGLGLFGGNVLEGFSGDQDDSKMAIQASAQTSGDAGTSSAVVTTASVAVTDTAGSAVEAAPQVAATQVEQTGEQIVTVTTPDNGAVQPIESAPETMVVDNSGGEGAEPMAPAQQAGNLITMAEQAKSSSRNEQVNMAKAVLTSSKTQAAEAVQVEVAEQAVVTKGEEVEIAINSTVGDTGTDPLIVIKDKVNLRDGPSIDHPIVLTLEHGQELMEFKREGKWIHVGAYGTSGKIGWVHERLVGPIAR